MFQKLKTIETRFLQETGFLITPNLSLSGEDILPGFMLDLTEVWK
ncbi:hypothetical protein [Planktothrix sp. FACHB-1365]|nr:hypothetical protein [Planktothrix sp. FACHB-1365]